jgi:peptidoglycan L-alanyl-D-glutamate endopeptidase CwlK
VKPAGLLFGAAAVLGLLVVGFPSVTQKPSAPPPPPLPLDERNEKRIALLHPSIQPYARKLIATSAKRGVPLLLVSGYRSNEEQARLYAQGRTAPGPVVTNAKPGTSWHNYGLAFDVVPVSLDGRPRWDAPASVWQELGALGESLGLAWGGRWASFPDRPHFQRTGGLSLGQAAAGQRPRVEPLPSTSGELRAVQKTETAGAVAALDNDPDKHDA